MHQSVNGRLWIVNSIIINLARDRNRGNSDIFRKNDWPESIKAQKNLDNRCNILVLMLALRISYFEA